MIIYDGVSIDYRFSGRNRASRLDSGFLEKIGGFYLSFCGRSPLFFSIYIGYVVSALQGGGGM